MERGKSEDPNDWRKFCIQRYVRCFFCEIPHHPLTKTLSCFFCVWFSFLVFHCFGVVRVLSPIRGRLFKSSLFCPCHLCLACLTSKYFSFFTFQCRQSGLTQQKRLCAAVLDGPDSISSISTGKVRF